MARRGPLTVQSVRYNRNGITGDGFFVVAFTIDGSARLAVLFPDGDGPLTTGRDVHGEPMLAHALVRCAIVDPAEPTMMHKAEGLDNWLAEAIDRWVADGRAFAAHPRIAALTA